MLLPFTRYWFGWSLYLQITVKPENVPKTAVIVSFGLFEFIKMSFGLSNAAQTVQRFIDTVLRDLPFCWAYPEDLFISNKSLEEHKEHLRSV